MTRPSESRLLTAREVCDLLRISKTTLNDWRVKGHVTGLALPSKQWRYPSHQPVLAAALAAVRRPA